MREHHLWLDPHSLKHWPKEVGSLAEPSTLAKHVRELGLWLGAYSRRAPNENQ